MNCVSRTEAYVLVASSVVVFTYYKKHDKLMVHSFSIEICETMGFVISTKEVSK